MIRHCANTVDFGAPSIDPCRLLVPTTFSVPPTTDSTFRCHHFSPLLYLCVRAGFRAYICAPSTPASLLGTIPSFMATVACMHCAHTHIRICVTLSLPKVLFDTLSASSSRASVFPTLSGNVESPLPLKFGVYPVPLWPGCSQA